MPQFFVPKKNIQGTLVAFDPSESRHLAKVLRKKVGEVVQIFDGQGFVSDVKLSDLSKPDRVLAELAAPQNKTVEKIALRVYPALLKKDRFEWMLEKLTELGVSSIQPLETERTLIKIEKKDFDSKMNRWKTVALSAAKQCGRAVLPEILPPTGFKRAVNQMTPNGLNLILWEGEEKNLLSDIARKISQFPVSKYPVFVSLIVGPEGGFTLEEARQASQLGWESIRLGENILRAETASIAAASVLLF